MEAAKNVAGDVALRKDARVLFLHNPKADPFLTHKTSIATYAAAMSRRGISTQVLDLTAPDFMQQLGAAATRPEVVAIHCEQSWGLDLAVQADGRAVDVFEYLGKPALAHIRDYPFYPWLRARALVPRNNRLLFFTEKSALDFVTPGWAGVPHNSSLAFAPHIYLEDSCAPESAIPWDERPISLLYVGSYADPSLERAKFAGAHPHLAFLLDTVIDAAIDAHAEAFWRIADTVAHDKGVAPDHADPGYLDLLVAANQFIRNERRRRLLTNLSPHPMHMVWSGPRPDIALHPDTVVIPGNKLPETLTLCRSAKAMVMCLNSFAYSLSERLLSAMERGAAPLCIRNRMIDETFSDGVDILALDGHGENIAMQLDRLRAPGFGARLTATARERVARDFSPDVLVGQFVKAIAAYHEARA